MKKKLLVAMALIGCLLMLAGCALAGFDLGALFSSTSVYVAVQKTETLGAEDVIQIDVDTETIRLGLSGDDQAHISYMDLDKEKHLCSYQNGVLSLKVDHKDKKWYEYINFDVSTEERIVEVLLPSGFRGRVEACTTTGAISANDLSGLKLLSLSLTTGDVTVTNCEANETYADTTTGRISAQGLRGDTFTAGCTSGAIYLNDLTVKALTASAVSGDISLASAACDTVDISGTTSKVRLDKLAAKSIVICVTTGDVTGTIACDPTEFTIDATTATGDNNLGTVHFGGERKLVIDTTTGDIQIEFLKP